MIALYGTLQLLTVYIFASAFTYSRYHLTCVTHHVLQVHAAYNTLRPHKKYQRIKNISKPPVRTDLQFNEAV